MHISCFTPEGQLPKWQPKSGKGSDTAEERERERAMLREYYIGFQRCFRGMEDLFYTPTQGLQYTGVGHRPPKGLTCPSCPVMPGRDERERERDVT